MLHRDDQMVVLNSVALVQWRRKHSQFLAVVFLQGQQRQTMSHVSFVGRMNILGLSNVIDDRDAAVGNGLGNLGLEVL